LGRPAAPPPRPRRVRPRPADRSEHVPAEDPRPDVLEPADGEVIVHAGDPLALSVHLLERAGLEEPLEHRLAPDAERVLEILIGAGAESIEGDAEAGDTHTGHGFSGGRQRGLVDGLVSPAEVIGVESAGAGSRAPGGGTSIHTAHAITSPFLSRISTPNSGCGPSPSSP